MTFQTACVRQGHRPHAVFFRSGKRQRRFGGGVCFGVFVQHCGGGIIGQRLEYDFGTQNEHAQAFDDGLGQVGGHDQQQIRTAVQHQHIGQHAAFRGVVGGVTGRTFGQVVDVVGKLAVHKCGAVFSADADYPEKR